MQDVAAFLYISGGRSVYEFLTSNLPLPSCRSALRYIHSTNTAMEGQLRIKELKEFLQTLNLPPQVWISDDSTGLINRIRYHGATNQVVGFVLPLDQNGMPRCKHYLATSAKEIENFFINGLKDDLKARLLHIVVAQPLAKNAPFFCLLMFGTNDAYDFQVVYKRWQYIHDYLKKEGIQVIGQSTDGDSRAFKVMRLKAGLLYGNVESKCGITEFKAHLGPSGPIYIYTGYGTYGIKISEQTRKNFYSTSDGRLHGQSCSFKNTNERSAEG